MTTKTKDREYCQRTFGSSLVTITEKGQICIAGDWTTNWGLIYPNMIDIFKSGTINPITGHKHQIIGMDLQPSETICKWIYSKIDKGFFDHLVKE